MVFSFHTTRKSVKNPHLFLLLTHSNDYYNTYYQYKKVVSVFIANLKVFQNTDLRFHKFYFSTSREGDGNDVTFPGRVI